MLTRVCTTARAALQSATARRPRTRSFAAAQVLPRPPPGVFVTYADEQPAAPEATLAALRAAAPRLPPPLNSMHAAGTVIPHFGAAHGQALRARLRLSCDDEGLLEPQLGGEWGAVLFMNDEKEFMWEIRGLVPVGAAGAAA